jgi:ABC-type bacteriocin/lantibiotic exporter with double-glycine peptidase domain
MAPVLTLSGLAYSYVKADRPIFKDLSLSVHAGEFIAIVGG